MRQVSLSTAVASPAPSRIKAGETPAGGRLLYTAGGGPSTSPAPSRLKAGETPAGGRLLYAAGGGPS